MPKVILIQPTQYGSKTEKPLKQDRIFLPGLALPLLASYTPDNWDVEIFIEVVDNIDFNMDVDIVGIGAMGHAVFRAMDIAYEFRKRGKKVFMGGYMVSIMPELVKDHCDSVVIGDGEISYPRLLKDFETSGEIARIYDNQLKDLNNLLRPRYELLAEKKIGYMLPVQAGRGCPHSCSYCSISCIYKGKYMFRPVDDVIRDIKYIKEQGFKRFFLIDDNIASNPTFLLELTKKIKPLKMNWASQCTILVAKDEKLLRAMVDSGCTILSIGLESLSQNGLDDLNKGWMDVDETAMLIKKINSYGIAIASEMIIGTDGDTRESIMNTATFINDAKIMFPKFYILTPLPGTEFYNVIKKQGRLLHENYRKYTAASCVFEPKNMSAMELEKAYFDMYRKVYSFKNILKRTIFNKYFFNRPTIHLFALFTNLVYKKFLKKGDSPNIL